jgi:hypothetical protein
MRHALMIAAALSLLVGFAAPSYAQKIDANGRCHDKAGKFAKAEVCKGGAGMMSAHRYKLDAKGNCHDEKGKMSKKEMCKGGGQLDFSKPENSGHLPAL